MRSRDNTRKVRWGNTESNKFVVGCIDPSCLWVKDDSLKPDPKWVTTHRGERSKEEGISRVNLDPQHEAARSLRNARMHAEVHGNWGTIFTCPSSTMISKFGFPIVWTKEKAFVYTPDGSKSFPYGDWEDIEPTIMGVEEAWEQVHSKLSHTYISSLDPFLNDLKASMKH